MASSPAEKGVKATVEKFFRAEENHDTLTLRALILPNATITSVAVDSAHSMTRTTSVEDLIAAIATTPQTWREHLANVQVTLLDKAAELRAKYAFSINGEERYCGALVVMLVKASGGWSIAHLLETQNPSPCAP